MSDRMGVLEISKELWLDMLCLDPKTHTIEAAHTSDDGRNVVLVIEGPEMPEVTDGPLSTFTPVYRKKDWERIG